MLIPKFAKIVSWPDLLINNKKCQTAHLNPSQLKNKMKRETYMEEGRQLNIANLLSHFARSFASFLGILRHDVDLQHHLLKPHLSGLLFRHCRPQPYTINLKLQVTNNFELISNRGSFFLHQIKKKKKNQTISFLKFNNLLKLKSYFYFITMTKG